MDNLEVHTQTLGEQRGRTSFNPSNESVVDKLKQKSAELIDLLDAMKLMVNSADGSEAKIMSKLFLNQ